MKTENTIFTTKMKHNKQKYTVRMGKGKIAVTRPEQCETIEQVRGKKRLQGKEIINGKLVQTSVQSWDLHCWLEVDTEKETELIDYDDDDLAKSIGMPKGASLIRRPFNPKLQKQCNKGCYKNYETALEAISLKGEEYAKGNKLFWINNVGYCMCRAYLMREEIRTKAKEYGVKSMRVVFGSLGWVDKKGEIYWYYG